MTASIGVVMTERGVGSAGELHAHRDRPRRSARASAAAAAPSSRRRACAAGSSTPPRSSRACAARSPTASCACTTSRSSTCTAGTIVAVEAFVRWQHPDHGLLSPAQFLSAAEATGLAVPLGAEILSIACRELAHWESVLRATSSRRRPCTSTSPRCTSPRRGSPSTVSRALQRSGLAPDKLVLEIAETMFTGEGQAAMAQLDDLRGVGVRIALDRFGTGYSSLAAIRQLPFDALKVDSSFLTELGDGTRDARARRGDGRHGALARAADDRREGRDRGAAAAAALARAGPRAGRAVRAAAVGCTAALELVRSGQVWSGLLEATRPPPRAPAAPPPRRRRPPPDRRATRRRARPTRRRAAR